jgi:dipeptidyl aminopeptidase/acylaminoacyl peptidase
VDYRYAAMVHTSSVHSSSNADARGGNASQGADRDLSWLNTSHVRVLSQDGSTLLFAETGVGTNYAVCLRKTDGSPVVRLGEGWPTDRSSDGKSVLAIVQSRPPQLVIYSTGAGETRQLELGPMEHYVTAQWLRDGKSILINGNEPGKGTRYYVQDIADKTSVARAVTPERTRDSRPSPDGKLILARGAEGKYSLYPIAGGDAQPVPQLAEEDIVAQWSPDGRSVLVYRRAQIPCRLEWVDLATGRRTLFKEFAPADRTGLLSMREIFVTDDLRSYAYTAYYQVSSLFESDVK